MNDEKKKLFVVATIVLVFGFFFHYSVSAPILHYLKPNVSCMEFFGAVSSIMVVFYVLYVVWLFVPDVEEDKNS